MSNDRIMGIYISRNIYEVVIIHEVQFAVVRHLKNYIRSTITLLKNKKKQSFVFI